MDRLLDVLNQPPKKGALKGGGGHWGRAKGTNLRKAYRHKHREEGGNKPGGGEDGG